MSDPAALDLDAIKARHAATTPGVWQLDGPYYWPFDMRPDPHMTGVITAGEKRTPVLVPAYSNPLGGEDLAFAVHAHTDLPNLLAEVEERLSIGDVDHFLRRERDEYEPRGECWNTVNDVLDAFRLHVITGTPLTEPRPHEGPEALGVEPEPLTEAEELRAEVDRLRAELAEMRQATANSIRFSVNTDEEGCVDHIPVASGSCHECAKTQGVAL